MNLHSRVGFASVLIAAVLAVLVFATVARPTPTDASWTHTENANSSFSAITVPAPDFVSCTSSATQMIITWKWDSNPSGALGASNLDFTVNMTGLGSLTSGLEQSSVSTAPNGTNTYKTTVTQGTLTGLLGSLLGSVNIAAVGDLNGWTSSSSSKTASVTVFLGVLSSNCSIN